jgi:dTDP-4-amino-4,6-dideoxygalactose transaminase
MLEKDKIYVTQPVLPSLEEYTALLKEIWESRQLTNNGPFHQQFERELAEYLGVKHLSLFTNGTLALVTALQALRITGEVITTPFSFVATTHSLWWNNIKPVFVDIEPDYFTLDPKKIEAAITPLTTAILPVHVYGSPCKVEAIQEIADTYGLKVIYDAAHAFGVNVRNNSVLDFGDLSVLSFHATKVFNTIEGGAIVCHDEKMKKRIDFLKNFGFADEVTVVAPGINAKMNELQAAFGLLQLRNIDENLIARKSITEHYRNLLSGIKGIRLLEEMEDVKHNYPYFPILIDAATFSKSRDEIYDYLRANNIYSRRYFYPLISNFPTYRGLNSAKQENLPVATKVAEQVLCLPIYPDLDFKDIDRICNLIIEHKKL